jgi:four helix bundle protein
MEGGSIQNFTDLIAWKKNHLFVKMVYEVTKNFPSTEQFGLTSQLRRAASSITANIAEGYGRYYSKDKARFYYQARGSNTECQNHIILAYELGYLTHKQYQDLYNTVFEGYKILCGLISKTLNGQQTEDDR